VFYYYSKLELVREEPHKKEGKTKEKNRDRGKTSIREHWN
jgi:hypothetical protein